MIIPSGCFVILLLSESNRFNSNATNLPFISFFSSISAIFLYVSDVFSIFVLSIFVPAGSTLFSSTIAAPASLSKSLFESSFTSLSESPFESSFMSLSESPFGSSFTSLSESPFGSSFTSLSESPFGSSFTSSFESAFISSSEISSIRTSCCFVI